MPCLNAKEQCAKDNKNKADAIYRFLEEWLRLHGEANPRVAELMVHKEAAAHILTDAEEYFDAQGERTGMERAEEAKFGCKWYSRTFFYKCWRARCDRGHPKVQVYPKHTLFVG